MFHDKAWVSPARWSSPCDAFRREYEEQDRNTIGRFGYSFLPIMALSRVGVFNN